MSELEQEPRKRDWWEKFEILSKGIAAILVTGGLTLYGIHSNRRLSHSSEANRKAEAESAEKNRKAQVFIETMNHRETAMSDMRSKMFDTLMQSYFRDEGFFGPGKEIESRVAILETIGLNFHDVLHLKPLFEGLDSEIAELVEQLEASDVLEQLEASDVKRENLTQQRDALRKAANRIKTAEILKIGDASGRTLSMEVRASESISLLEHDLPVVLHLREVTEEKVRLVILDPGEEIPEDDGGGFTVGYFDMPLQDNSRLGELTYSVLLEKIEPDRSSASIKVVVLPKSYTYRNNLVFDQMLVDYMEEKEEEISE